MTISISSEAVEKKQKVEKRKGKNKTKNYIWTNGESELQSKLRRRKIL